MEEDLLIKFDDTQAIVLNFVLAYLMFAVALDIKTEHFTRALQNRKGLIAGIISQILLLPLLTLILVLTLKPAIGISMGMLLISVCPGGNISNYAVYLAKGNTALSILLTSVSTLFSAIHVPVTFSLLLYCLPEVRNGIESTIQLSFTDMLKTVVLLLVLPVLAGIAAQKYHPDLVKKYVRFFKISSLVIFSLLVVGALYGNWDKLPQYLQYVFGYVFIHNTAALLLGFLVATLAGLALAEKKSLTIETGIQNSGLALVLAMNFFPTYPEMALIAAWWSIWHLISAFSLSFWWSYRKS